MADEFATGLRDIGGAVSDLFGARGAVASAGSYDTAASIAEQNALLAREATKIKETQLSRQIFRTTGAQIAGVGGAGFAESGTALDLLRSSVSEGALTKAIAANQGAIQENAYAEQAGLFRGMAGAARSSGRLQTVGGIVQGAAGAWNLYQGVNKLVGGGSASVGMDAASVAGWPVGAGADAVGAFAGAGEVALGMDAASVAGWAVGAGEAAVGAEAVGTVAAASEGFGLMDLAALAACFITTAITKALGKPDDCDELLTLRAYRDTWLRLNHPEDIDEYYRIAPGIVAGINKRPDAAQIWHVLYSQFIVPSIDLIKEGQNSQAYDTYKTMVHIARAWSENA